MAVDMFLKIEGEIEGESKDSVHTKAIDVMSYSWGLSQPGSFHMGGGGGAGKASFSDLTVMKAVDNSSPTLMLYCANGDHFESAELIVRKAGKEPLEYYKIKMIKVLITSVQDSGSGGSDQLMQSVSLNFEKVELAYSKQLEDGSGETPKEFKWDIGANVTL